MESDAHHGHCHPILTAIHNTQSNLSREVCDARKEVAVSSGDGRITTEREASLTRATVRETTCDLEKSTRDGFSTARVDVISGFKDALRDAERVASAALLNQEKIASAAALLAHQNACALAKQLAECCCEQKELTREQGEATRSLVRQLDCGRTERDLQDTKNELAMLKLRCTITPVPAPAVTM